MTEDDWNWVRRLDAPLTGDVCAAVAKVTGNYSVANPRSVFAYALWRACLELNDLFGEEQGIPADQFQAIQKRIQPSLREIMQGGLREGTRGQWDALADMVEGLNALRRMA